MVKKDKDWTQEIEKKHDLKKGTLDATGYSYTNSVTANKKAIRKGIKMYGYHDMMAKMNFVANVNKNRPYIREPARKMIAYMKTIRPAGIK